MPDAPQITLTATLDDLTGQANMRAKLRITLCNFGGLLPRVAGTTMIASTVYEVTQTGASISIPIWGNDAITPNSTFYCVEVISASGNRIQAGNYLITGGGSQDLSNLPQYFPPPPPELGQSPVLTNPHGGATQEIHGSIVIDGDLTVTGTINGSTGGKLVIVAYAPVVTFDGNKGGGFKLVLTGDTTIQIVNMQNKLYIPVLIEQDGVGGHAVTWSPSVKNHGEVNPGAGVISTQAFMADQDGSLIGMSTMQYS